MNEQVKTCPKCGIAYSAAVYGECANCNPDAPVKKNAKIEMVEEIIYEELANYNTDVTDLMTTTNMREIANLAACRIVAAGLT